jgi:hypothetical protein
MIHPDSVNQPLLKFTIQPIDLVRRLAVYDGCLEDDDWHTPIAVPQGIPRWNFTLAEIDPQDFKQLRERLGDETFQAIATTQGYLHPPNECSSYRGNDNLPLHYYIRETHQPHIQDLILVSFGEFQPMRWLAHIEGVWQIIKVES